MALIFLNNLDYQRNLSDRLLTYQSAITRNYINLITRCFLELIIIIGIFNPNNPYL